MKGQLPSPDFDANVYDRPNRKWVCEKTLEGRSCRVGPGPDGSCRATFECRPVGDVREGEQKGRYRCTRTRNFGGACEDGPLPDGSCSRPIARCRPIRSIRAKRGLFTRVVMILCGAFLLLSLLGPYRFSFINPGGLSAQHSGAGFARLLGGKVGGEMDCLACHTGAGTSLSQWIPAAFAEHSVSRSLSTLFLSGPPDMAAMDRACQDCHGEQDFHQANVMRNQSCSACHQEHLGTGPMAPAHSRECVVCHGNQARMQAAAARGEGMAPSAFHYQGSRGIQSFGSSRPKGGFTRVVSAFDRDHPEFLVHREMMPDPGALRFNHQLHLQGDVPNVDGRKLDCRYCHRSDKSGAFFQPITYQTHCLACHALQFDAYNPRLTLPHRNARFVRAFLRTLATQYADFGVLEKGLSGQRSIDQFVSDQMEGIRRQYPSGEDLEAAVFKSRDPSALVDGRRSRFPGCALCHEVGMEDAGPPEITPAAIPNRWLLRSQFNHAKHLAVACTGCHSVGSSRETADINLPRRRSCVTCHSPQGGVAHDCISCHRYHNRRVQPENLELMAVSGSLN